MPYTKHGKLSLVVALLLTAMGASAFASEPVETLKVTPVLASEQADSTEIQATGGMIETVFFFLFAIATIGSALGVVFSQSIVRMAVWLFASFGAVAMLFFLMQAYFLAVVQLIVYAGGILVLIVFGIMLTSSAPWVRFAVGKSELALGSVICLGFFMALCHLLYYSEFPEQPMTANASMNEIGRVLITTYLVPFELAGVVLLVVMVGAAYLARQEPLSSDESTEG